jgi:uncharacterized membrane protein YoaK (UPF0700 family)
MIKELTFAKIAQLLALIICVSVSLMRGNLREMRENLKRKIRSKEKHFLKSKLEFLLLIVKFLDPVAEEVSRKL